MNFHTDEYIMENVRAHCEESAQHFPKSRIVGIFYQGSGNYGLDYENSDVDTKLIVTPTFKDIVMNNSPVSTTHVRDNDEHIDFKDIRLYLQTFRKQNLNFIEILFTKYKIINSIYEKQWNRLVDNREYIARYSPDAAIKAMIGVAKEKYFAMEHHYPSRIEWINKFGYDPKQLHHLLRIQEFIERYIRGDSYEDCLITQYADYLIDVKKGFWDLEKAREYAKLSMEKINNATSKFLETPHDINSDVDSLLDSVQYEIMKSAIQMEI